MNFPPFAAVHNGGSHLAHLSRASSDAQLATVQDALDITASFRPLALPALWIFPGCLRLHVLTRAIPSLSLLPRSMAAERCRLGMQGTAGLDCSSLFN